MADGLAGPAVRARGRPGGRGGDDLRQPCRAARDDYLARLGHADAGDGARISRRSPLSPSARRTAMPSRRVWSVGRSPCDLQTDVETGWRPIPALTADIPGTVEDRYVMLSGHVDSWHYGAMDNASADATMLEVGRIFSEHTGELRRGTAARLLVRSLARAVRRVGVVRGYLLRGPARALRLPRQRGIHGRAWGHRTSRRRATWRRRGRSRRASCAICSESR